MKTRRAVRRRDAQLNVRISEGLKRQVAEHCKRQRISVNDFVERAVKKALDL